MARKLRMKQLEALLSICPKLCLEPIPCRGERGFFRVPDEVADAVREQSRRTP